MVGQGRLRRDDPGHQRPGAWSVDSDRILRLLLATACWLSLFGESAAVVVFEQGKPQPTVGYLVREEPDRIVLREVLPDGNQVTRSILRGDISELLIAVSAQRLERLHPADPNAYRDYAEELAAKHKDPDARQTGLRLYLIAAYLEPQRLGRSCLLGMLPLARNRQEERRFRAMAYLLDPQHDRSLLKPVPQPAGGGSPGEDSGMLKAVRAMRRGQRRMALAIADREPVRAEFQHFSDVMSWEQFHSIGDEIGPEMLRKLLVLEWMLTRSPDEVAAAERGTVWSQLADRQQLAPVLPLTLETLTEFDPRECLYRHGRWVRPETER